MRKIDLTPYAVKSEGAEEKDKFKVRQSLIDLLFYKVEATKEVLARGKLADKIEAAGDHVLLENTDWERCRDSVDRAVKDGAVNTSRHIVEFIRRVMEAEEVQVEETKKTEEPDAASN